MACSRCVLCSPGGRSPFDPFEDTESPGCMRTEEWSSSVAAHSIRSRILKGLGTVAVREAERGRSPFDPFEDTESRHLPARAVGRPGRSPFDPFEDTERPPTQLARLCRRRRSPFDPFEDTERAVPCPPVRVAPIVAAHSIRSRILKARSLRRLPPPPPGRSPFDPFEDTESLFRVAQLLQRLRVAAHSIRSRILKAHNYFCQSPFPSVAAHSIRSRILKATDKSLPGRASAVAAHSIRSRILKGCSNSLCCSLMTSRSPFDPFEDTES